MSLSRNIAKATTLTSHWPTTDTPSQSMLNAPVAKSADRLLGAFGGFTRVEGDQREA
jgi:hypothetical protein